MINQNDEDLVAIKQHKKSLSLQKYGNDISHIEMTQDYFDTKAQINNLKSPYTDTLVPKKLVDSNKVVGIFSNIKKVKKLKEVNQNRTNVGPDFGWQWPTNQQILENVNEENVDKEVQKFRQGIEINSGHQMTSGFAKISAGTPGHLLKIHSFGFNDLNIGGVDKFVEIDLFNPIHYINLQENEKPFNELITFPIVTSDVNQLENYILNGIIEPFPIRPVIALFSINTPFEPRSVKGQFGNGNLNTRFATSQVVSIDYFNNSRKNKSVFLDAIDIIGMKNDENDVTVNLGPSIGYYSIDENNLEPFDDQYTNEIEISANYDLAFIEAVKSMKSSKTTYVTKNQKCYSTGFVFDNVGSAGVDSIAFGGLKY